MRHVVALDFDGTLSDYGGGEHFSNEQIGPPIAGMKKVVELLQVGGAEVVVFSARAGTAAGVHAIQGWLKEHGFPALKVTAKKLPAIRVILDDRAMAFEPAMAKDPAALARRLLDFQPHYRRKKGAWPGV